MVVMSADDHGFCLQRRIAALDDADHVPHRAADLHGSLDGIDGQIAERPRLRLEVAIDLIGHGFEIEPGAERPLHAVAREIDDRQPVLFRLRFAQPPPIAIERRLMVGVIDDQQGFCAARPRHFHLAQQRRVHGVRLAVKRAATDRSPAARA